MILDEMNVYTKEEMIELRKKILESMERAVNQGFIFTPLPFGVSIGPLYKIPSFSIVC